MKPFKSIKRKTEQVINNLKSLDESGDDSSLIDKDFYLGNKNIQAFTQELKFIDEESTEYKVAKAQDIVEQVGDFDDIKLKTHRKQQLGYALGILSILLVFGILITLITLFSLRII
ncbi:hypothetical protein [Mycoplasmopsis columboralis]|uniref:Uncharacterized protein n=1 Tax=Mycoplasmopsis columboralis TaxID=171282 RepID=A0A449B7K1_9BACT|nr:hypothetical protein [Mycoplasmopsis columboralis]VEU76565.1 Uncharacterised protein [Mycoplasmopsis columboralis]